MNDTELDRLLDSWQAPEAPPSLRAGLRARFPRADRQVFAHPLRWLVATGVAFAVMAAAMGQNGDSWADSRLAQAVMQFYQHIADGIYAHRVAALASQIQASDPQVFVDGKPAPALERRHSTVFDVQVPGDGVYSIVFFPKVLPGWVRTGQIQGNYIEFEAGAHHVVIICNHRLLMSDSPVLVRRRQ
jgi:hypothetical protein